MQLHEVRGMQDQKDHLMRNEGTHPANQTSLGSSPGQSSKTANAKAGSFPLDYQWPDHWYVWLL